jgi:hypothetical protein
MVVVCPTCEAKDFDYPGELRHHFEQHPVPDPNTGIDALEAAIANCRDAYRKLVKEHQEPLAIRGVDRTGESELPIQFEFRKIGTCNWKFCFESESGTLHLRRELSGLAYIQALLSQLNGGISCPALESPASDQVPLPTTHRGGEQIPIEMIDELTRAAVIAKLKNLEEDRAEAIHLEKPREKIEELDEEIAGIKHYLAETTYNGDIRVIDPDLDQSYDRVSKAISRAYDKLEGDFPRLVHHLRQFISIGKRECKYSPASDPEWFLYSPTADPSPA